MFPPTLLDTSWVCMSLDNVESGQFITLIKNSRHMKYAVMEDLDGDLLIGQFTAAIVQYYNSHRIVSESRGGHSLWIPTLDSIALGLSASENSSLLDLDNSTLKWHIVQHLISVEFHRICVENHCG